MTTAATMTTSAMATSTPTSVWMNWMLSAASNRDKPGTAKTLDRVKDAGHGKRGIENLDSRESLFGDGIVSTANNLDKQIDIDNLWV